MADALLAHGLRIAFLHGPRCNAGRASISLRGLPARRCRQGIGLFGGRWHWVLAVLHNTTHCVAEVRSWEWDHWVMTIAVLSSIFCVQFSMSSTARRSSSIPRLHSAPHGTCTGCASVATAYSDSGEDRPFNLLTSVHHCLSFSFASPTYQG